MASGKEKVEQKSNQESKRTPLDPASVSGALAQTAATANLGAVNRMSGAEQVAPLSEEELRAVDVLGQSATDTLGSTGLTRTFLESLFNPTSTTAQQEAQRSRLINEFNTRVAPATGSAFQNAGSSGSTAQWEQDVLDRSGLGRVMAESDLAIESRNKQLGLAAAGMMPMLGAMDQSAAQGLMMGGGMRRGIAQNVLGIDAANIEAARADLERLAANRASQVAGLNAGYGNTSSSGTQVQTKTSAPGALDWTKAAAGLAGGIGLMGAGYPGMFGGGMGGAYGYGTSPGGINWMGPRRGEVRVYK